MSLGHNAIDDGWHKYMNTYSLSLYIPARSFVFGCSLASYYTDKIFIAK